ncbi:unnamed protein product [Tetraodon nigroviridis]|uniref:(spotted green pufferfish) hypothetical protein n=1 Tax=Tetraodon nigroviridis TaxID=99883 RepID=Q4T1U1_TETNG|nr:unnamed protein product [Tetraodon nigroviridis]
MTQAGTSQPEGGARGRWKALKAESRSWVEQTEDLLWSLQDRIQQVHSRRQKVSELIQDLDHRKQQSVQLREARAEEGRRQLTERQQVGDKLQVQLSVLQELMQCHLLSIDQSELSVELRPRPPCSDQTSELDPLRLSVSWSQGDHFQLQVPAIS